MARHHDNPDAPEPVLSTVRMVEPSQVFAGVFVNGAGERRVGLRVYVEGEAELELDLTDLNLPEIVAGIEAGVAELMRMEAVELGLEAQEAAAVERNVRRRLRVDSDRARRRMSSSLAAALTCSEPGCSRPTAIIDADGTRYCKRHAEAAGIRPTGKIGGESDA